MIAASNGDSQDGYPFTTAHDSRHIRPPCLGMLYCDVVNDWLRYNANQFPLSSVEHSSYYDRRMRQSAALIRARRPYLIKNSVLGLGISAFALGVCE